ncbi:MAG: type II toxin-antitoxin system RelE/ParE family toxin [Burkholderiales bacterium]
MSTVITIRVDDEVGERLDRLAAATQRSRSFLAAEALRDYLKLQEWQIGEIQAGVSEADSGDLIPHRKVMKKSDAKLAIFRTSGAEINLLEVIDYIAADNPTAALRIAKIIREQVEALWDLPNRGRPGRVHGTRELLVQRMPYIVMYRVLNNSVEIL